MYRKWINIFVSVIVILLVIILPIGAVTDWTFSFDKQTQLKRKDLFSNWGCTIPPTAAPTLPPTAAPTLPPTAAPTLPPTAAPTAPPTAAPKIYLAATGYYPQYTVGSPPTISDGIMQFRGSSWLNYPNTTFDMSKGFSFIAYFRFTANSRWQRVFDFANGSPNNNIIFAQKEDTNQFRFSIFNGTTEYPCDGGTITYNTYQKFVGIYNPSSRTISTYINDSMVNSITLPTAITDTRTLQNCYIGKSNWSEPLAQMDLGFLYIYN